MIARDLLPPAGSPARKWALLFLYLSPVLMGIATLLLGQDASWDTRNYHIYNAWAFVTGRYAQNLDLMPSQGQFFFNPLLDVPFYLLATFLPVKLAYFILGCVQGLNIPLLFMLSYVTLDIADAGRKTAACAALALLGVFSGMGISEIGTQFNDNLTSIGILLTALLVLRNLDFLMTETCCRMLERGALCGLPAGLALGLKITCLPFCLGLCIAALVLTPDWQKCLRLAVCVGLGITFGFLLTYGHWGYYLWQHFGSPMFPFFNALFRSPLLPPSLLLDYPMPRDGRLFVFPFYFALNTHLVNEIDWRDLRVPVLYLLLLVLPVWYFAAGRRTAADWLAERIPARFLLLVAGVAYYGWLFSQTIYRYLLPLDMTAPLLIVAAVGLLPLPRPRRVFIAAGLLALIALSIQPGNWGRHDGFREGLADMRPQKMPENSLVILSGTEPYAYLLPAVFSQGTSFVRIDSRGFPTAAQTGLHEKIRLHLRQQPGEKFLFVPKRAFRAAQAELAAYELMLTGTGCRGLEDEMAAPHLDKLEDTRNGYPRDFLLCPVVQRYVK